MTITDEKRLTNGHATTPRMPTITLSSGYTIGVNRQPGDVLAKAKAAAQHELESERPPVPTQNLETEPGVFRDIPNEHDPAYQQALAAWNTRVAGRTSQKLLTLMERIGLVFDVDTERLRALRESYALLGMELPEDDRSAYLGYVLAPTNEDQARLFMEVFGRGLPQEAQVALHRRMFPGDMAQNAT